MGVFAEFLTIRPWEMELLDVQQFQALCKYIDDKNNQ